MPCVRGVTLWLLPCLLAAQGQRLEGRWAGGDRSGTLVLVLSRDRRTFTGRSNSG